MSRLAFSPTKTMQPLFSSLIWISSYVEELDDVFIFIIITSSKLKRTTRMSNKDTREFNAANYPH